MSYMRWRVLTYRLTAEQSRHRVAIWRELRRIGAVSIQQATWAIPAGANFEAGLARAIGLVERGGGTALLFEVTAAEATIAVLEELYSAEREAEWVEFLSECDKCETELKGEFEKQKFTLAELDEEEQNVDRLRRWFRELRTKDLFGAPSASQAGARLKDCSELLEDFAERVFEARDQS
jgi:hypothetical protein